MSEVTAEILEQLAEALHEATCSADCDEGPHDDDYASATLALRARGVVVPDALLDRHVRDAVERQDLHGNARVLVEALADAWWVQAADALGNMRRAVELHDQATPTPRSDP
jgi:hypothetical protein